jgi:hypothetical protein
MNFNYNYKNYINLLIMQQETKKKKIKNKINK